MNMNILLKLFFCGMLLTINNSEAAISRTDSMINIIQSLPQDSIRLQKLDNWRNHIADTPEELRCLDIMINDATLQQNINYQALAYRNRVRYFYNAIDMQGGIKAAEPAISFFRKYKLYDYLFETESMIITLYTWHGKYEYSLLKGDKMYAEAMAVGSTDGKVSACYAMGYACYTSKRTHEALSWYQEGLDLLKKQSNIKTKSMEFCILISECYEELEDYSQVEVYATQLYKLLQDYTILHPKLPDTYFSYYWLWLHTTYAKINLENNRLKQAKAQLDKASQHIVGNTYNLYMDILNYTYSDYYLAMGNYQKALEFHRKGVEIQGLIQKGEDPATPKKKAHIYNKMKEYQLAAYEIEKSVFIADSLNDKRYAEQSQQLHSIYGVSRLEADGIKQTYIIRMQLLLLALLGISAILLIYLLSRFYRMKQQLSVATIKATEANEDTSGFLNSMSNKIKQFLDEIAGLSDALIQETDENKRQEYAAILCKQNELAQHVIFEILDISKIESDKMQFNYEETDLDGLMNEVCSHLQIISPDSVRIKLISETSKTILTDPSRLSQILNNLIRHLVTHIKEGEISFRYKTENGYIRFYITGDKWNITDEELKNMFDRFVQTSRKLQDINLGMIIARGLILKMGGSVTVFPKSASDARIEFTLPTDRKL